MGEVEWGGKGVSVVASERLIWLFIDDDWRG